MPTVKDLFAGAHDDFIPDDGFIPDETSSFVPDSFVPDEEQPARPEQPPSLASRLAKAIGEMGADFVTGGTSILSLADPVLAGAGAAASYAVPYTGQGTLAERFHNEMDSLRRGRGEAFRRSPVSAMAGAVAPMFMAPELLAKLPAPATRATVAAGTATGTVAPATLAASGIHDAALMNAAMTGAQNIDLPDVGGRVSEAAVSPVNLIGAAPAVVSQLRPVDRLRNLLQTWRERRMTPEARLLRSEGVPTTVGQENPSDFWGRLEAVSADNPMGMKGERGAAREAWQLSQVKRAVPESGATSLRAALQDADAAFQAQYAGLRKYPVSPENVTSEVDKIVANNQQTRPRGVDDKTWKRVGGEVRNALTVLGGEGEATSVGDLMDVRHQIRMSRLDALRSEQHQDVRLYREAEKVVTRLIETNLPPDAAAALREIDRRYATVQTLTEAMPKGRSEFTPYQVLKSVEDYSGGRAFARGQGGPLQASAEAADESFRELPFTGGRATVLQSIPGKKYWAGPVSAWANTLSSPGASTSAPQLGAQSINATIARLSADPRTATYGDTLKRTAATAGPAAAAGLHFLLFEKDPAYRAAVTGQEPSP